MERLVGHEVLLKLVIGVVNTFGDVCHLNAVSLCISTCFVHFSICIKAGPPVR